jgi:hypothetical protein
MNESDELNRERNAALLGPLGGREQRVFGIQVLCTVLGVFRSGLEAN